MSTKLVILLSLSFSPVSAYNHSFDNPNHYLEYSFNYIKQQLETRVGQSYYDILILQVHVNVNAKYVETTINEVIDRKHNQQSWKKCQDLLVQFKKKSLENCRMTENFDLLRVAREKWMKLNEVACLTIEICEELNPLKSQASSFEFCTMEKIADLNHQTVLVDLEFENLRKKLFADHDSCIRSLMSNVYNELADIVYGVCLNSTNLQ